MLAFFMQVSCGFRPAYKADAYNENFLTFVEITPMRTIEGTNFYNHLRARSKLPKERRKILPVEAPRERKKPGHGH